MNLLFFWLRKWLFIKQQEECQEKSKLEIVGCELQCNKKDWSQRHERHDL